MIAGEPTLAEMLAEPIVRLVMAADRVDEAMLHALVARIAEIRRDASVRPDAAGSPKPSDG